MIYFFVILVTFSLVFPNKSRIFWDYILIGFLEIYIFKLTLTLVIKKVECKPIKLYNNPKQKRNNILV